jgi:hypothetical protein
MDSSACSAFLSMREDFMRASVWFSISLLATTSCGLAEARDHNPCELRPLQTGWHVFVDYQDGFCFEYPPKYHVAPAVVAPGVSRGNATRFIGRLTTKPSPSESAIADDPGVATIDVSAFGIPFRPEDLTKFAPTGEGDSPPQRIHAAHGEFYYYGGGGGGVLYPDVFYFGIRGRTLSIDFIGPYSGDKIPDPETRRIEPKVLASFRTF